MGRNGKEQEGTERKRGYKRRREKEISYIYTEGKEGEGKGRKE